MNPTLRNRIAAAIASGLSAIAIAVIMIGSPQGLEGRRYVAYRDIGGVWTVCNGHTGNDIVLGEKYTDAQCDAFIREDLAVAQKEVDHDVKITIPNSMRASLYTFTLNVGVGAFHNSTLLKQLNAGNKIAACNSLMNWTYAGGRKSEGLKNRRTVEKAVCEWQL